MQTHQLHTRHDHPNWPSGRTIAYPVPHTHTTLCAHHTDWKSEWFPPLALFLGPTDLESAEPFAGALKSEKISAHFDK